MLPAPVQKQKKFYTINQTNVLIKPNLTVRRLRTSRRAQNKWFSGVGQGVIQGMMSWPCCFSPFPVNIWALQLPLLTQRSWWFTLCRKFFDRTTRLSLVARTNTWLRNFEPWTNSSYSPNPEVESSDILRNVASRLPQSRKTKKIFYTIKQTNVSKSK